MACLTLFARPELCYPQPQSEYHRVEVLYDCLLPWLADRLLPEAILDTAMADPGADYRTPARAGASF